MKPSIRVSIPKPCHEQWSSFTPTPDGGFCANCSKNVIDFTCWDEERIKAYFQSPPANTCGRFRAEQLTVYTLTPTRTRARQWWPLMLAGLVTLFTSRQAVAQTKTLPATEQYQPPTKLGKVQVPRNSPLRVSGVVKYADDNTPLAGVNVIRKGTAQGTATNADGIFSLTLERANPTEVLVFSFIGLKTVEYTFQTAAPVPPLTITLQADTAVLGGIVLVGAVELKWYNPKRWWWGVKRTVRRIGNY